MRNASQINHTRNSVRVERSSDLDEFDLGAVYCIFIMISVQNCREKTKYCFPRGSFPWLKTWFVSM